MYTLISEKICEVDTFYGTLELRKGTKIVIKYCISVLHPFLYNLFEIFIFWKISTNIKKIIMILLIFSIFWYFLKYHDISNPAFGGLCREGEIFHLTNVIGAMLCVVVVLLHLWYRQRLLRQAASRLWDSCHQRPQLRQLHVSCSSFFLPVSTLYQWQWQGLRPQAQGL